MTEMNTAWTAASEDMYKATQDAGQQPGADGGQQQQQQQGSGSENVTDAEFEEVK
jgi:molecular chaperone DnaK